MSEVYLLHHMRILDYVEEEDNKFIGVYSSHEKALQAVGHLKEKPGFKFFPNVLEEIPVEPNSGGFFIEAYEIDKDHWEDGFVTI